MSNAPKKTRSKRPAGQQRQAPAVPSPWPKRILVGLGTVVGLALVVMIAFQPQPLRGVPDGTEEVAVASGQHVDADIYGADEVPAGGPHSSIWQNCGFYDQPIDAENATHSLEHGAVWVTYRPGDVDGSALKRFVGRVDKVIVSPVAGQEAPIMATAWGHRLTFDDPGDPKLEQFVNEFKGSSEAPEPSGACNGGVGQPSF